MTSAMSEARLPVPFVVGCGRSGTSLLYAMLDVHPDLSMVFESHFVPVLARRRYRAQHGFDASRFLDDLFSDHQFARNARVSREDVRDALVPRPKSYAEAARRVFAAHARVMGKSRFGDKTPGYVVHIGSIAALFPEARFVHLIRDGRDVAAAYVDRGFHANVRDVGSAAMLWKGRVTRGQRAGRKLGPSRYLEVRYEDLVAEPEPVLRKVCEFVDLGFVPRMVHHAEHLGERAALATERFEHVQEAPRTGMRDWRVELTGDDIALFEVLAGGLLSDLGYERADTRATRAVRLRAARAASLWEWKRLASSTTRLPRRHR